MAIETKADKTRTKKKTADEIRIIEVRIRNFRSLVEVDVSLDSTTVLIGENNTGKTSFLEALYAAIGAGRRTINEEDIFINKNEKKAPKGRTVTIDVLIRPVDSNGKVKDVFPEGSYWVSLWGSGIAQDEQENDFIAIRTQMKWNSTKGEYDTERRFLLDWPEAKKWEEARVNETIGRVPVNQIEPIALYYMDAKRDIQDEMQNRSSFWYRLISDPGLTDGQVESIEKALNEINQQIIKGSDVLSHVQRHLNEIYKSVPCDKGSVAITPLTRHIRDLSKGMDINFATRDAQSFPLSRHGMGTRCLAALLIFRAYSEWRQLHRGVDQVHSMLALEEPEAHLHPQAQRALFIHIEDMPGQRIISTHSPYIAGQASIKQFRHFRKEGSKTLVSQIDISLITGEEERKIERAVLNTRGDLLFARAILLCSGETEEQGLPIYAEKYWNSIYNSLGMSFVGVGGDGNYLPFLLLASGLNIRWYICSDGEDSAIKKVKSALQDIGIKDLSKQNNVFILPDGHCYETYLVSQGYCDVIETMLNSYNTSSNYVGDYIEKMDGKMQKGGNLRDYSGKDGREKAIVDILTKDKTMYATPLAKAITSVPDEERKIPKKIKEIFEKIQSDLTLSIPMDVS